MFSELGLPFGNVMLLDGAELIQRLARGEVDAALNADLELLCRWPVVVRTDVADDPTGLLLPHSNALSSTAATVGYLASTALELPREVSEGRLAFLLHRFVAARVGAFAYARPDMSRVRIDATWGVPDSLLFHPHDTYEVDLKDPDRVRSQVRCKGHFVDVNEAGEWVEREAGWNWDWRNALTPEQVRTIADIAHRIAKARGQGVQVMFFVGIAKGSGHADVLPWFVQADDGFDPAHTDQLGISAHRQERTVRTIEDLRAVEADITQRGTSPTEVLIVLRPTTGLIRDAAFLHDVGATANRWRIPVALEGSVLSHAFYVLRRSGAMVYERRPDRLAPAPALPLNKLVRDGVPNLVLERSEDVSIIHVDGDELLQLLALKAVEEAFELAFADGDDAALEELSDLFEVVRSIALRVGLTLDELEALAARKREARGGFDDGVVLLSTSQRALGDPGHRQDSAQSQSPGRIPPHADRDDVGQVVIRMPVRSVGLTMPVRLRHTLTSGKEIETTIRWGVDGVDVTLSEREPVPSTDQLTLEF